jgi:hypothetical protein
MISLAKEEFGKLDLASHLVYVPSVLLGGTETVDNIEKMDTRAAMICNGDIAVQLDNGPPNGSVIRVEPYEDTEHRTRLKLIWK